MFIHLYLSSKKSSYFGRSVSLYAFEENVLVPARTMFLVGTLSFRPRTMFLVGIRCRPSEQIDIIIYTLSIILGGTFSMICSARYVKAVNVLVQYTNNAFCRYVVVTYKQIYIYTLLQNSMNFLNLMFEIHLSSGKSCYFGEVFQYMALQKMFSFHARTMFSVATLSFRWNLLSKKLQLSCDLFNIYGFI